MRPGIVLRCGCRLDRHDQTWALYCTFKCKSHRRIQNTTTHLAQDYYHELQGDDKTIHIGQFIENFGELQQVESDSVLEIGAGTSQYVPMFLSKGYTYAAVEPSVYAADWINSKYGVTVHNTAFESFKTDKQYDIVFSAHCLEHFKNAIAELHHMKRLLKPNGLLYVLIPDDSDLSNSDHYWFFNTSSISEAFELLDMEVVSIKLNRYVPKENFIYIIGKANSEPPAV